MTEYPEHEKLKAVSNESQAIGEFIEHSPYTPCEWKNAPAVPRWIDSRTGTDQTPRHRAVSPFAEHAVENPDWFPEGYYPTHKSINQVLADYFDIDLNKLELEKRAMLDELREANAR